MLPAVQRWLQGRPNKDFSSTATARPIRPSQAQRTPQLLRTSLSQTVVVERPERVLEKEQKTRHIPDKPPESPEQSKNTSVSPEYRQFLDLWDVGFSFDHMAVPEGCYLNLIDGQVPAEMQGTFFRNGPGQFAMGDDEYGHPYDGDGLVASFSFQGGRVFYRSRFITTPEFELESAARRVLFRGSFATSIAGNAIHNILNLYIKNNSNTSAVFWGDRLLTMFEAAPAMRLDPATLATQGMELLGGRLRPGLPVDLGSEAANQALGRLQAAMGSNSKLPFELVQGGGDAFTAHPHEDSNTGRLCFFTYHMSAKEGSPLESDTVFRFWEVDKAWNVVGTKEWTMPGYGFTHDMGVTKNYFVVWQGPVATDQLAYVTGQVCAASSVRWKPGAPTYVWVIPRPGSEAERRGERPRRASLSPPLFVFHVCNAYEEEQEEEPTGAAPGVKQTPRSIVYDAIAYDSLPAVGKQAPEPPLLSRIASTLADSLTTLTGTPGSAAKQQAHIEPDAGFKAKLVRAVISWEEEGGRAAGAGQEAKADDEVVSGDSASIGISPLWGRYLELPSVSPAVSGRQHRYIYGYSSVFDVPCIGVSKVDTWHPGSVDSFVPPKGIMFNEPTFVPRPGASAEDDGWLVGMVFDALRGASELVVLDARSLSAGPVARLALPGPLPHALHGCWADQVYGPIGENN